ncbi:MAG TPA: hypothetical protein VNA23_11855 [Anaerolineales bacterium]|nr:hypothetical protein [Anaerolineales bacterium]
MAGTRPMSVAESVMDATNSGRMVPKDANPSAMPNRPPSLNPTDTLYFRSARIFFSNIVKGSMIDFTIPVLGLERFKGGTQDNSLVA